MVFAWLLKLGVSARAVAYSEKFAKLEEPKVDIS